MQTGVFSRNPPLDAGGGAGGGTRTPTLLAPEPKSGASTSSATPALLLALARSGVCIAPGQAQSKAKKSRFRPARNFAGKGFRALIFSKLICARMNIRIWLCRSLRHAPDAYRPCCYCTAQNRKVRLYSNHRKTDAFGDTRSGVGAPLPGNPDEMPAR